MYTEFYGLKEQPFNLTPSPRFLYLSEGHKEALALLKYGVMARKGFILLTGEVGTGKTTMVRTLLDSLTSSVKYVLLSNPLLSQKDFVNYLALSVFKKKLHFHSKAHFLLVFEPYLKQTLKNRENFNLIIDEAHKLSFELLEEIRLLSNMETRDEKLVNIFLVGQPELNEKLSDPRCRSLLQRISIRHHIHPLNLEETREYMATRLKVAGAKKGNHIFSKRAVDTIYDLSKGYPREINTLADNALLLGYSRERKKITPSMAKECYEDMQLDISTPGRSIQETEKRRNGELESVHEQAETQQSSRVWKWAAALLFFIVLSLLVLSPSGEKVVSRLSAAISSTYQEVIGTLMGQPVPAANEDRQRMPDVPEMNRAELPTIPSTQIVDKRPGEPPSEQVTPGITPEKKTKAVEVRQIPNDKVEDNRKTHVVNTRLIEPTEAETPIQVTKQEPSRIVIVGRGDTLTGLALKIYGKTSREIIAMVKAANPDLKDIHFIKSGQKIVFPKLSELKELTTFTVHLASYKLYEPALSMYRELLENGYEVYILPKDDPQKGKIFRVTLGNFQSQQEANIYAATILEQGVSGYANPVKMGRE
jgi:general secretion pathway protein A